MLALVIILTWLLINTFTTVAITVVDGSGIEEWDEFALLVLCAIISPWFLLGIKALTKKKHKTKSEPKIYWAEDDE